MRKQTFYICENKDADQLLGNCEADQGLCFHCIHSTIPLLSISKISSLEPSSVAVQPVFVGPGRKPVRTTYSCQILILFLGFLQLIGILS